jgi:hypothetical protein
MIASGALLIACVTKETVDVTSKSSASITEASLSRLPFKVPRLPLDRSERVAGRFVNASISSSARFLRAAKSERRPDCMGYLTFIAEMPHSIYRLRMAKSRASCPERIEEGVQFSPDGILVEL